jgi:hypothetical protein
MMPLFGARIRNQGRPFVCGNCTLQLPWTGTIAPSGKKWGAIPRVGMLRFAQPLAENAAVGLANAMREPHSEKPISTRRTLTGGVN